MFRTVVWYTYFWMFMIFSILLSVPVVILYLPGLSSLRTQYIRYVVRSWARSLIFLAGGKISIKGLEKIPKNNRICFVSNHQGAFDIPLILGYLPSPVGFIAKKELVMLPIVNLWMKAIGCIFIDRSNRRDAVKVMQKGVEQIEQGKMMIIFPEGTRSRGPTLNPFKKGSLKLAIRSQAEIVPVTISGSYKLKEETGRIQPAEVQVTIHDPVSVTSSSFKDTDDLTTYLTEVIATAL